jgi:hypothetical protein
MAAILWGDGGSEQLESDTSHYFLIGLAEPIMELLLLVHQSRYFVSMNEKITDLEAAG